MFKVMNGVRVDAGEVRGQEEREALSSLSAMHCQHNTCITSTPFSTMSLRHQSGGPRGRERECRREADKSVERRLRRNTPKCPVSVEMRGVFPAGYFLLFRRSLKSTSVITTAHKHSKSNSASCIYSCMQHNINVLPHSRSVYAVPAETNITTKLLAERRRKCFQKGGTIMR